LKRWAVVGIVLPLTVWGYRYEPALLKIHAKLAPRLMLMAKETSRPASQALSICLLHEKGDEGAPERFEKALGDFYPDGLHGERVSVVASEFGRMETACRESTML